MESHLTIVPLLAVGQYPVVCKDKELVHLTPPSGQTCGDYLTSYINASGGYITDPSATDTCSYCSSATTDEFLANNFNIFYSQRWRNFGLMWAYIFFNVSIIARLLASQITDDDIHVESDCRYLWFDVVLPYPNREHSWFSETFGGWKDKVCLRGLEGACAMVIYDF